MFLITPRAIHLCQKILILSHDPVPLGLGNEAHYGFVGTLRAAAPHLMKKLVVL
jgi:hypothetical protein